MDGGNGAIVHLLDLKKIFDTVNHKNRNCYWTLNRYRIRDIAFEWFCRYLLSLSQAAVYNGTEFEMKELPQGSNQLYFPIYGAVHGRKAFKHVVVKTYNYILQNVNTGSPVTIFRA